MSKMTNRHTYQGDGIGVCSCGLPAEHDLHDEVGCADDCEGQNEDRSPDAQKYNMADLYESYLLGCEDECLPDPMTLEQFAAHWTSDKPPLP